jgi:hypothetical protein
MRCEPRNHLGDVPAVAEGKRFCRRWPGAGIGEGAVLDMSSRRRARICIVKWTVGATAHLAREGYYLMSESCAIGLGQVNTGRFCANDCKEQKVG